MPDVKLTNRDECKNLKGLSISKNVRILSKSAASLAVRALQTLMKHSEPYYIEVDAILEHQPTSRRVHMLPEYNGVVGTGTFQNGIGCYNPVVEFNSGHFKVPVCFSPIQNFAHNNPAHPPSPQQNMLKVVMS